MKLNKKKITECQMYVTVVQLVIISSSDIYIQTFLLINQSIEGEGEGLKQIWYQTKTRT